MAKGAHGGKRAGKSSGASQSYTMTNGVRVYSNYTDFLTGELGYDVSTRQTTEKHLSVRVSNGVDVGVENLKVNGKSSYVPSSNHKITNGADAANRIADKYNTNKMKFEDGSSGKLLERLLNQFKSAGWSVTAQSGKVYILERKR